MSSFVLLDVGFGDGVSWGGLGYVTPSLGLEREVHRSAFDQSHPVHVDRLLERLLALAHLELGQREVDGADAVVAREAVVVEDLDVNLLGAGRLDALEEELLVPLGVERVLLLLGLLGLAAADRYVRVRIGRAGVIGII